MVCYTATLPPKYEKTREIQTAKKAINKGGENGLK